MESRIEEAKSDATADQNEGQTVEAGDVDEVVDVVVDEVDIDEVLEDVTVRSVVDVEVKELLVVTLEL